MPDACVTLTFLPQDGSTVVMCWAFDACVRYTIHEACAVTSSCSLVASAFCSAAACDDPADSLTVPCYSRFFIEVLQFCKKGDA